MLKYSSRPDYGVKNTAEPFPCLCCSTVQAEQEWGGGWQCRLLAAFKRPHPVRLQKYQAKAEISLRCRRVCRDSAANLLQKEQGAGRAELALLCRLFTHFPPMSQLTTACIYSKMDLFLLWYHMRSAELLMLNLWWQSNAQSSGFYLKSFPSWCLESWGITAMSEGIPHKVGEFPFTGSKPSSRRNKHHAATLWHEREWMVSLSSPKPGPKWRLALLSHIKMTREILTESWSFMMMMKFCWSHIPGSKCAWEFCWAQVGIRMLRVFPDTKSKWGSVFYLYDCW